MPGRGRSSIPVMADSTALREALTRTLDDGRLSRSERSALRGVLEDHWRETEPGPEQLAHLRAECFRMARDAAQRGVGERVASAFEWCEDVVQLMAHVDSEVGGAQRARRDADAPALARFSPRHDCWKTITDLVQGARGAIDVCVFTVTDNRISGALKDAHRRGVRVRLVTDDEKSQDPGSDVFGLRDAGIAVAWDSSPDHMHHKFALFDDEALLTGSYNWTRSAASRNQENIVVSGDAGLIAAFRSEFDRLWRAFA
jgi:cardiolipin hydrolase